MLFTDMLKKKSRKTKMGMTMGFDPSKDYLGNLDETVHKLLSGRFELYSALRRQVQDTHPAFFKRAAKTEDEIHLGNVLVATDIINNYVNFGQDQYKARIPDAVAYLNQKASVELSVDEVYTERKLADKAFREMKREQGFEVPDDDSSPDYDVQQQAMSIYQKILEYNYNDTVDDSDTAIRHVNALKQWEEDLVELVGSSDAAGKKQINYAVQTNINAIKLAAYVNAVSNNGLDDWQEASSEIPRLSSSIVNTMNTYEQGAYAAIASQMYGFVIQNHLNPNQEKQA